MDVRDQGRARGCRDVQTVEDVAAAVGIPTLHGACRAIVFEDHTVAAVGDVGGDRRADRLGLAPALGIGLIGCHRGQALVDAGQAVLCVIGVGEDAVIAQIAVVVMGRVDRPGAGVDGRQRRVLVQIVGRVVGDGAHGRRRPPIGIADGLADAPVRGIIGMRHAHRGRGDGGLHRRRVPGHAQGPVQGVESKGSELFDLPIPFLFPIAL